ncbi:MAG: TetR/AcrR family transcriptional regulator [Paludibacteraceae bacterium]|nr:TetR/AcrR family transcriptional regulator [Paludibacteraceae bacterium]
MSDEVSRKILEGALKMFTQNGIKSITMDDIAISLSMSKRTIYEKFKDKNTLIFECLKYMDEVIDNKLVQISSNCSNTMVEMMATTQEIQRLVKKVSPNFWKDIKNLDLPNDYCRQKELERQVKQEIRLTKGQEEGLIRKDISVNLLSTSISDGIRQMAEKAIKENPDVQIHKIINTFIKIFYRGIATEKGLQIIEEYEKTNPAI